MNAPLYPIDAVAQRTGYRVLGFWDNGFRQTTSSTKPINGPDDLKGFKIRVPVSPLWTSMFKAFDAAPASINFSEVYSALQTKIVEGQENPLAIISTAKLYEVQKFCSLTNHMWDGFWFLANRRAWEKLPEDVRAIVAKHINAAAVKEREDVAKLNAGLQQELAGKGLTFNQPNVKQVGFIYRGNQGHEGEYGIMGTDAPSPGVAVLDMYCPDGYVWENNTVIDDGERDINYPPGTTVV